MPSKGGGNSTCCWMGTIDVFTFFLWLVWIFNSCNNEYALLLSKYILKLLLNEKICTCEESFCTPAASEPNWEHLLQEAFLTNPAVCKLRFPHSAETPPQTSQSIRLIRDGVTLTLLVYAPAWSTVSMSFQEKDSIWLELRWTVWNRKWSPTF